MSFRKNQDKTINPFVDISQSKQWLNVKKPTLGAGTAITHNNLEAVASMTQATAAMCLDLTGEISNEDFRGNLQHKAEKQATEERRRTRQLGTLPSAFQFSDEKQLARPIPLGNGLFLGSESGWAKRWLEDKIRESPEMANLITAIPISEIPMIGNRVPLQLPTEADREHFITRVPFPGLPGNRADDEHRFINQLKRRHGESSK
ncbi:hypothetical protein FZEAL_5007 [Fusarium zealandicum]|uniref:Uncharacterized protein n=1 Tax=Fusarium zealandicum TaxID=1053134 RepID=A0A8H4UL48_9HYPO|nr:hypothetical protein FZEAL_5007 [Fusarium zealandicum]